MDSRTFTSFQRIRRSRTAAGPRNTTDPTVRRLRNEFWEFVIHARGPLFRGLSSDPAEARARALAISAGARGVNLGV